MKSTEEKSKGQNRTADGRSDRSKWTTSRGGPEYPGQTKPEKDLSSIASNKMVRKAIVRQKVLVHCHSSDCLQFSLINFPNGELSGLN